MSDSARQYQAKIVRELQIGNRLPSIEEIVTEKLQNDKTTVFKREDIVQHVAVTIGYPSDRPLALSVTAALRSMESKGLAKHLERGLWQGV